MHGDYKLGIYILLDFESKRRPKFVYTPKKELSHYMNGRSQEHKKTILRKSIPQSPY
ncbi:hypothetical protein Mpsy_2227 [Methanolobus psychrophilus R15]|nr:hypothetical protein Mpsy_2227 [Methanolobus psychrophilus R15]